MRGLFSNRLTTIGTLLDIDDKNRQRVPLVPNPIQEDIVVRRYFFSHEDRTSPAAYTAYRILFFRFKQQDRSQLHHGNSFSCFNALHTSTALIFPHPRNHLIPSLQAFLLNSHFLLIFISFSSLFSYLHSFLSLYSFESLRHFLFPHHFLSLQQFLPLRYSLFV